MIDVKVRASFILQGSILPAEQSTLKSGKKKRKKKEKEKKEFQVNYKTETIKLKKETVTIKLRQAKPVTQTIQLSLDAYNYMTDPKIIAYGKNSREWGQLSKNKRLKYHLEQMAEDLCGTLDSFVVLED